MKTDLGVFSNQIKGIPARIHSLSLLVQGSPHIHLTKPTTDSKVKALLLLLLMLLLWHCLAMM